MTEAKITIVADGVQAVQDAFKGITDAVSTAGGSFDGLGEQARAAGETLQTAFENPLDAIRTLGGAISDNVLSVMSDLGPAGEAAAGGLGIFGAAAVALSGTLFALVDHAASAGEAVEAFALKTGTAVENVGPLQFAAQAAGGSLEDLTSIVQKMDLKAATDQGGKFSAALQDIGINADAFKQMDSEAQILALGEGFREGAASGNLMADALAIGGRGMGSNIPLIEKMNDDLLTMGKTMGLTWTPEMLEQSREFSTDLNILETSLGNIATKIGIELLPTVSSLIDTFTRGPDTINGIVNAAVVLGQSLGVLTVGMGGVAQIFVSGFDLIKAAVLGVETGLVGLVAGFANLDAGFEKFLAILPGAAAGQKDVAAAAAASATEWNAMTASLASQTAEAAKSAVTQSALSTTIYQVGDALLNMGTHADTATAATNQLHSVPPVDPSKWQAAEDAIEAIWDKGLAAEAENGLKGLALQLAKLDGQQQAEDNAYAVKLAKGQIDEGQYWEALAAIQFEYDGKRDDATAVSQAKYEQSLAASETNIEKIWDDAANYEAQLGLTGVALNLQRLDKKQADEVAALTRKALTDTAAADDLDNTLAAMDYSFDQQRAAVRAANERQLGDQLTALWQGVYNTEATIGMTTSEKQIAAVDAWYLDQVDKAIKAGVVNQTFYDNLYDLAQRKTADVIALNDPFVQANKTMRQNEETDWNKFQTDIYGGFTQTFSVDIINALTGQGGFRAALQDIWKKIAGDILAFASDALTNFLQGFINPAEKALGGWLNQLVSGGSSSFVGPIDQAITGGATGGGAAAVGAGLFGVGISIGGGTGYGGFGGELFGPGSSVNGPGGAQVNSPGNGNQGFANEGYDLTTPVKAWVGDNPFQSESVLHASTVKDIVRAARSGGSSAPAGSSAFEDKLDDLHATFKRVEQHLRQMPSTMTRSMRDSKVLA